MGTPRSVDELPALLFSSSARGVIVRDLDAPPAGVMTCIALSGPNGILITRLEAERLVRAGASDERRLPIALPRADLELALVVQHPRTRRRAS